MHPASMKLFLAQKLAPSPLLHCAFTSTQKYSIVKLYIMMISAIDIWN